MLPLHFLLLSAHTDFLLTGEEKRFRGGLLVNREQRRMLEVTFVIVGCLGIYAFTSTLQVVHYCNWTGLQIRDRIGHEVTFFFANGTQRYYCCVSISLLAFDRLIGIGQTGSIVNIRVRCPMCGMSMDWDDQMIVWITQPSYLCPTTGTPTIASVCQDLPDAELCESHFLRLHGGNITTNPYIWPL